MLPVLSPAGEEWVLKINVPHEEFSREIRALQHFNGKGSVRLINANPEKGWMIMEQLLPGTQLAALTDAQQTTSIAVNVMQRLWSPVTDRQEYILLEQWLNSLEQLKT